MSKGFVIAAAIAASLALTLSAEAQDKKKKAGQRGPSCEARCATYTGGARDLRYQRCLVLCEQKRAK
jgi:hypothetical protein